MRTTIDLPDDLFRQVKAKAALKGVRLKTLITQYVEEGLQGTPRRGRLAKSPSRPALPVILPARGVPLPVLSPAENRRLEEQEDEAKHARSA